MSGSPSRSPEPSPGGAGLRLGAWPRGVDGGAGRRRQGRRRPRPRAWRSGTAVPARPPRATGSRTRLTRPGVRGRRPGLTSPREGGGGPGAAGGPAAAGIAGLVLLVMRSTLQVRTVPERVLEWMLLFVPLDVFEAGLRRFGFDAKRCPLRDDPGRPGAPGGAGGPGFAPALVGGGPAGAGDGPVAVRDAGGDASHQRRSVRRRPGQRDDGGRRGPGGGPGLRGVLALFRERLAPAVPWIDRATAEQLPGWARRGPHLLGGRPPRSG